MDKKTKPINFRADVNDLNMFQRLYPNCLSRFLRRSIKKAIKDKNYLFEILFDKEN